MTKQCKIHLVGSIGLSNEEEVFRSLADCLGSRAMRYPDGETGERHYWIRWQKRLFENHPHLHGVETSFRADTPLVQFRTRDGIPPEDIAFGELGYAKAAVNSYRTFRRLKAENVIPAAVRFLVALPTPVAVATAFAVADQRPMFEIAYEAAMAAELKTIREGIPADELAVQWDVCHEILAADGAFELHFSEVLEGTVKRLRRLCSHLPAEIELGFHLCYGDPGHKHIKDPLDTGTAVAFANELAKGVGRPVQWIHLPVPRSRNDAGYFGPLKELEVSSNTQIFLGLVHFTDGIPGTLDRVQAARKFLDDFGIATECGFGRREAKSIPELLRIHAQVADSL